MANAIKYSSSAQTLALKKGNYWIGTGDVGKGPTSSTDYWHGITPPTNGYTIYVNKANNGPSIRVANNDAELIAITNQIAGTNYNTTLQCFNYFQTQSDKMVVQKDYENIVTDGLVLNLDAGFLPSYPQNGSSWDDLSGVSGTRNATLVNGPVYSSDNGGRIYTDGTNDYISLSNTSPSNPPPWALHHANSVGLTLQFWVNYTIVARNLDGGIAYGDFFGNNASGHYQWQWIKHITGSPSKCYMGFQCVGTGGGYNLTLLDTDTTFVANTW